MNNSIHNIALLQEHIDQKRYESARLALAQRVLDRLDELEGSITLAYKYDTRDEWEIGKTPQHILELEREFATLDRLAYPKAWVSFDEDRERNARGGA